MSWKYNAIKTMKAWHPNIWRDEEVRALHFIKDKPREKRMASDDIGGHLGRDGKTGYRREKMMMNYSAFPEKWLQDLWMKKRTGVNAKRIRGQVFRCLFQTHRLGG